jgi:hypothetical protein
MSSAMPIGGLLVVPAHCDALAAGGPEHGNIVPRRPRRRDHQQEVVERKIASRDGSSPASAGARRRSRVMSSANAEDDRDEREEERAGRLAEGVDQAMIWRVRKVPNRHGRT